MYSVSCEPISLHVPLIFSAYPSPSKSRKKKALNLTLSVPSISSSPSSNLSYVIALCSSGFRLTIRLFSSFLVSK